MQSRETTVGLKPRGLVARYSLVHFPGHAGQTGGVFELPIAKFEILCLIWTNALVWETVRSSLLRLPLSLTDHNTGCSGSIPSESKVKGRPFHNLPFCPNTSAVALNDALHGCQADAKTGEISV